MEKKLPAALWGWEVVAGTIHILNCSPTAALKTQTPYEALYAMKPMVKHYRVFGCIGFVLTNSHSRKNFDAKSTKCVLIGYSEESKAYRMLNPSTWKVLIN